jgi:hypothetical protein
MNRLILLAVWGIALMGALIMSCADPLDDSSSRRFNPVGPFNDTIHGFDTVLVFDTTVTYDTLIVFDSAGNVDTVVVLDSAFNIDTVVVFDSTFNYDTVVVYDTTVNIDTVVVLDTTSHVDTIVIDPSGSGGFSMVCARLSSAQKEIVWMFRNAEGLHLLEFAASTDSDRNQTVTVDVDGQTFEWNPVANPEYVTEQYLGHHATIRITSNKPPSLGHAIDICLTVAVVAP